MNTLKALGYPLGITAAMMGTIFLFAHAMQLLFTYPVIGMTLLALSIAFLAAKHYKSAHPDMHMPFSHAR